MKLSRIALLLWLFTIAGWVYYLLSQKEPPAAYPGYEQVIQRLNSQKDSLTALNQGLQQQIDHQLARQESIKAEIKKKDLNIEKLKRRKNEKISAINNYDHDELYLFFARLDTQDLRH